MSMDVPTTGKNADALYRFRERLLPWLLPAKGDAARADQIKKWERNRQAGGRYALAHVLFLRGRIKTPEFQRAMAELDSKYPDYSPLKFLRGEVQDLVVMAPTLIRAEKFLLQTDLGGTVVVELSAVKVRIGEERAAVIFVDNRTRKIYGQKYIDARKDDLEKELRRYTDAVLSNLRTTYQRETALAVRDGKEYPTANTTLRKISEIVVSMTREY
jgi:hypothetical protein